MDKAVKKYISATTVITEVVGGFVIILFGSILFVLSKWLFLKVEPSGIVVFFENVFSVGTGGFGLLFYAFSGIWLLLLLVESLILILSPFLLMLLRAISICVRLIVNFVCGRTTLDA